VLHVWRHRIGRVSLPAKVDRPSPLKFSTGDYPLKDRVAFWREVIGCEYLRLDIVPFGDGPLRATAEIHALGPVRLYLGETTPGGAERTKDLTRDGNGDFRLVYAAGAGFQCSANGIVEDISISGAALISSGMPSRVFFPKGGRIIGLRIKREALIALAGGLKERPLIRLVNSLPLNLLKGYIEQLRQDGSAVPPAFAHKLGQQLVELAALALYPAREKEIEAAGAVREARLAAIKADILLHLGEARLSANTVAQRHGVSPRHIQRLFEQTGQTFSEFVLEERLKRAYQLLIDPAQRAKRIGDIAAEGGFGDISTFNRTFRRRFGETPRAVRQFKTSP
jgi:AraC-like DNA-binding protein